MREMNLRKLRKLRKQIKVHRKLKKKIKKIYCDGEVYFYHKGLLYEVINSRCFAMRGAHIDKASIRVINMNKIIFVKYLY